MGKASSAKKVARAARAGGTTSGTRKNVAFPAAMVVLVLLGVGLVVFARNATTGGDGEPALGDHWHAAYGIYICDRWVTNLSDRGADSLGIHTHDDGVVHIHPFLSGAAGDKATLGKFFEQVGVEVTDSSIELPPGEPYEGRKYVNDETTCGGEEARVVSAYWADSLTAGESEPDDVRTGGISGENFEDNFGAYTIAFLPEDADIPPPPTAADVVELGRADGGDEAPIEGAPENNELPEGSGTQTPADPLSPGAGEVPIPEDGSVLAPDPPTDSTEAPPGTEPPAGG